MVVNENVKRRVLQIGFCNLTLETNPTILLKLLLKTLGEKTNFSIKLHILVLIEEEWESLLPDQDSITLAVTVFRDIVKNVGNDPNHCVLQGQCLMTSTSILLTSLQRTGTNILSKTFSSHLEYLLTLIAHTNNPQNVYLRSVAASCLMETEINCPGILLECLDCIYILTASETSTAHQQYLELLTILMIHSQETSVQAANIPSFSVPAAFSKIGTVSTATISSSELEQMISFTLNQLPLLSTAASVRVAACVAALLQVLNPQASLSDVHLLQPLLQQYLHSHCLSAFQLVVRLEHQFMSSSLLKDDSYCKNILEHLIHCSTLPVLPTSSRLIFLAWLKHFLMKHSEYPSSLSEKFMLYPLLKDGSHTRIKKCALFPFMSKAVTDSSNIHVVLNLIDTLILEVNTKQTVKEKSAFIKIVFIIAKCYANREDINNRIKRCLIDVTKQDVSFSPFLSNILHNIDNTRMKTDVLGGLMNELIKFSNISTHSFLYTLEIMLQAVETQNVSISQPKEILIFITNCLEKIKCEVSATLGHYILSLCHKIMKLFDASEFLKEMETVLKKLREKCTEEDVQNRAQSYMMLLTCLSDQKVKEVLQAQKRNLYQLIITEGMFHKPDTLHIMDVPLFRLQIQSKADVLKSTPDRGELVIHFDSAALELYYEYITRKACTNAITIPVVITLTEDMEMNAPPIQAAAIFFNSNSAFGRLETLLVGNLTQKIMLSRNKEVVSFLKYYPEKVYPTKFHARHEFAMNEKCYCYPHDIISIDFVNLLQPLPVPDEYITSAKQWRRGIFSCMWSTMQQNEEERYCIASTVVNLPVSQVHYKIKHELKPFIIQKGTHEADLGFYLAPIKHVLLKATLSEDATVFAIATDDIYLLAHVNDFFSSW